jgi:tetratricopeptide (TPR) repeat protein
MRKMSVLPWKKFALSFFALFCVFLSLNAQSPEDGWEAFKNNDYQTAEGIFENHIQTPEANIGLAFNEWYNHNYRISFFHVKNVVNTADNPYPYLYALWHSPAVFQSNGKQGQARLDFLESLYERDDLDARFKSMVNTILYYHYRAVGDFNKADKYIQELDVIDAWMIAGGFDNISRSGFNNTYGPINKPKDDAVFKNDIGVDISWFKLPVMPASGWIYMDNFDVTENRIFYAQSFVQSPIDQEVELRFGVSGSVKVWMNDKLIFSEAEERNNGMDTYVVKTKLYKGNNRLLFQLGAGENDRMNFSARFTLIDKGTPVPGLVFQDNYKAYQKETTYESELIKNPYLNFFKNKIEKEPDNFLNYMLISSAYSRIDYVEEALDYLLKANDICPDNAFIYSRLLEIYAQRNNRTKLVELIEWMRNNDEENYYSLAYRFSEAMGNEDFDEADVIINKIREKYGTIEEYYSYRIQYLSKREETKRMTELMYEAFDEYPENADFLYYQYLLKKNVDKSAKKAIKVLKKYQKNNYNQDVIKLMASTYFELGNIPKGLALWNELLKTFPSDEGLHHDLASTYYQLQRYDLAKKYMEKCVEMTPYYGFWKADLANVYEQLNMTSMAIQEYAECIRLSPTHYDARVQLNKLKNVFSLFETIDELDADKLFENAGDAEKYPEDNSVVFLQDVQVVIYPEGGSQERHEIGIKVLNNGGLDDFKEYYIGLNSHMQRLSIEKAEVMKQGGNKVPAEASGNHIVFTNLEVGDAIHIVYKIKNYWDGKLKSHFWDRHQMQLFYPLENDRYSLIVPDDKSFHYELLNDTIKPVISEPKSDYKLYTWQVNNMPSIKGEDLMPSTSDYAPVLYISTLPDWNFVAQWYHDLTKNMVETELEADRLLEDLFPEEKEYTEQEIVQIIYDYIVEEIRYSSVSFRQSAYVPQKTTKTLNTRLGDCKDVSLLFVSLCRDMGLKAELVLVNTRNNGLNDMPLPSIHFNHAISKVWIDGNAYYVELTSDKLPFGALTSSVKGAIILDINDNTQDIEYLETETLMDNYTLRDMIVSFVDGKMHVTRKNIKTGDNAHGIRSNFRDIGKDRQIKSLTESITNDFDSYIEVTDANFENLEGTADSVIYHYSFIVDAPFNEVGSLSLFELPWGSEFFQIDFLSHTEREYPIMIWNFDDNNIVEETITLTIPDNMKIFEMPESEVIKSKYADYSINYSINGNQLKVRRHCKYKEPYIPVDEYDEFKAFYKKVFDADNKNIAFKKK